MHVAKCLGGGGGTYLKSVDWDICEMGMKNRQTDRQYSKYGGLGGGGTTPFANMHH